MKRARVLSVFYMLPYLLLLLAGLYKRMHCPQLALMDSDSGNYLIPPFIKQLTGEWHKGERPMQYLMFIYYTLTGSYQLKYTVFIQQLLSVAGAGFLAGAWIVFVNPFKGRYSVFYHVLGWVMLAIYISSAKLVYYAQFIGPESVSMFIMCVLVFCLSVSMAAKINGSTRLLFAAVAMFFNLYLASPMPKCVFTSLFLEAVLVYIIIRVPDASGFKKVGAIVTAHLLFLIVVVVPERMNKINFPHEDRANIEYEQMVYTHFDLLAQDKSNFALPDSLNDSLVFYLGKASMNKVGSGILGFNNDDLMWGSAANLISEHYRYNDDSIVGFYKRLCKVLITKYPFAVAKQIGRQIWCFYLPNNKIHKNLYADVNIDVFYEDTKAEAADVDLRLVDNVAANYYKEQVERLSPTRKFDNIDTVVLKKAESHARSTVKIRPMAKQYPSKIEETGLMPFVQPWPGFHNSFIIRWFDYIFITVMLGVFVLGVYSREIFKIHLLTILYAFIFIYVATVAIVHTLDIERFITTIYPFMLVVTFMGVAYIINELMKLVSPEPENVDAKF